jgi:ATP-dependent Clp protease ATP-binding subunit ClpB
LSEIEKQIADLKEVSSELELRWKSEKEIIQRISTLKDEIDKMSNESEIEERKGNLEKVAQLRYSDIPAKRDQVIKAQHQLKEFQAKRGLLKEQISEEEVATIVARWTHIPVSKMLKSEMDRLKDMETNLKQRVIGQEEAIAAVSNALRRSRAGISEEKKPIGSFIFLGPTGVGKTELAKALAEFMFDKEDAMIRVDMSEYMEKHSVSKMIGSPPGYIGHDESGQLTERIRKHPYSVVLFDEIEKAHPDIFNLLLQILDDGHVTDSKGRKVNFKNTIIIMTSNIGSDIILHANKQPDIGFNGTNGTNEEGNQARKRVMAILQEQFRPEFLNRIDEIIFFHSLTEQNIESIVQLQIDELAKRLTAQRGITITVTKKAKQWLGQKGYDPQYGARPLKRLIQNHILNPLALSIVAGEMNEDSTPTIDVKDDAIVIKNKTTA